MCSIVHVEYIHIDKIYRFRQGASHSIIDDHQFFLFVSFA